MRKVRRASTKGSQFAIFEPEDKGAATGLMLRQSSHPRIPRRGSYWWERRSPDLDSNPAHGRDHRTVPDQACKLAENRKRSRVSTTSGAATNSRVRRSSTKGSQILRRVGR